MSYKYNTVPVILQMQFIIEHHELQSLLKVIYTVV